MTISARREGSCARRPGNLLVGERLSVAKRGRAASIGLAALLWCAASGHPGLLRAEEAGGLRLELNRLEPVAEACRAYLLIENGSPDAYRSLKLDLFAFDTEGVIAKRLAVEAGPVAPRKTSVKLFDFSGVACERFSRVLLNDVIACEPGGGAKADCLPRVSTGSKIARVDFVK